MKDQIARDTLKEHVDNLQRQIGSNMKFNSTGWVGYRPSVRAELDEIRKDVKDLMEFLQIEKFNEPPKEGMRKKK